MGNSLLAKEEGHPIEVRLVGVCLAVAVWDERRRATGTVVDVGRGERDARSVLDIEVGLFNNSISIIPCRRRVLGSSNLNTRLRLVIATVVDPNGGV